MNENLPFAQPLEADSKHQVQDPFQPKSTQILGEQIKMTQSASKQISQQFVLAPKKVYLPHQQPISLISGNNRSRSNNETVKRTSPYTFVTRENVNFERTSDQIRMKIILENSRLKSNIETLRQDINYYKDNELKIIDILRQSKLKISEYKQKLKEKSKKISEITDRNINLKNQLAQLQSKNHNLSSYSDWQDHQINLLKIELAAQTKLSKQKIDNLQALLKKSGLEQASMNTSPLNAYVNQSPQGFSEQTIGQRTPYSIKEMAVQDIQSIKQRYYDEQQINQLKQTNLFLKSRLLELETDLDQMRTVNDLKQRSILKVEEQKQKKEGLLKDSMESIMEKQLEFSRKLSQKQSSIENLEKELLSIREYLKNKEQSFFNSQEKLNIQIKELRRMIYEKDHAIIQITEKMTQQQQAYNKELQQIQLVNEENQARNRARFEQYESKIQTLTSNLQENERKMEEIIQRNQELEQYHEQYQERIKQASNFIQQKQQYEQICSNLKDSLEYYKKLPEQNLKFYQEKLSEAEKYIKTLENENKQLRDIMERYAVEIRALKNDIMDLNRDKQDNNDVHRQIPQQKQQSQEGIVQLESETSLMNELSYDRRSSKQDQIVPIFHSHPLEQQQELKEEDQEEVDQNLDHLHQLLKQKEVMILDLKAQIDQLKKSFQERLDEHINKFTVEVVQANYQLQQKKEIQDKLKGELVEKEKEIEHVNDRLVQKAFQIEQLVGNSQKLIQQKEEKQKQLKSFKSIAQKREQEISLKEKQIASLVSDLQQFKNQNQEYLTKISQLNQLKSTLENQVQKLRQEQEAQAISKRQLKSSLQLHLTQKQQIESELYNSKRLVESALSENQSDKALVQQLTIQIDKYKITIKQFQDKISTISSEKNKLHEEIIARMIQKDDFNQKYLKLQSEIAQLRHYRKQQLDQIQQLKRSTCEIQVTHTTLQGEKQALIKKIEDQSNQIASKSTQIQDLTQKLQKSNIKIAQLQQFEKKTKIDIEQKLAILSTIIDEQKKQIQKLNFEKEELKYHKETHVHSITQLSSSKKKLEISNEELEKQLHEERKSTTELKGQISKLHGQFQDKIQQSNKWKDKLTKCEQQIKRLKIQNDLLTHQKEQLIRSYQQTKTKLQKNELIIKDLSTNIVGLKQSLEFSRSSHQDQINNLKESINRSNQQSISIKLQEEQSKLGIGNLKQQISQIQIRHKSLVQDYEHRIRSTSVKIEQITIEKQATISQLQATITSLKEDISEINKSKDNQQATIKQLNKVISDTQSHLERLQAQLTEQRDLIASKDLVISSLQKNLNIKRTQIEQKDRSNLDLRSKLNLLKDQLQQKRIKQESLNSKLSQSSKQHLQMKEKLQKQVQQLTDQLQIAKKILQQTDEDNNLRTNKLNKQISNYKLMLQQAQKQTSFKLEQSNKSINEIKTQLKVYIDTIKQKESEIKEFKEANHQLKQQLQKKKMSFNRFEEERSGLQKQKQEALNRQNVIQQELNKAKIEINSLRSDINAKAAQLQNIVSDFNTEKTKMKQLQNSQETLLKEKSLLESKIDKLTEQKVKIESKLQNIALERTKFQTQCENLQQQIKKLQRKNLEETEELNLSTSNLIGQRKQLDQRIAILTKDNQSLRQEIKNIQKKYQERIENISLTQRQLLLDVENKHEDEIKVHTEQIEKQRQNIDILKEEKKQILGQFQSLKQKYKLGQKIIKDSENQRGQLTDKILQLTQQNSELNQIIDNLRNNLIAKENKIEQCQQAIGKLQEELEDARLQKHLANSNNPIKFSIQTEKKLTDAYQYMDKLHADINEQQQKFKRLEQQLKKKNIIEKDLIEKIDKMRQRQNRQRNSSCDSWVSKSKIFDEKSQALITQLQEVKNKLSAAEAYILMLEEQHHHKPNNDHQPSSNLVQVLNRKINELEKEIQNNKIQIEYQEALIKQLDNNSNLNSSIRSKRSAIPVEIKQKQQLSKIDNGEDLSQKIYLLIDFIQNYTRDNTSGDKEQQLKSKLSHPALQQLLSTIFYRLERETIIHRQKDHRISQFQEQIDGILLQLKNAKQSQAKLLRKCSDLENKVRKFQKQIEQLLTNKMKDEADIAQFRSITQQLETKLAKYERNQQTKKEGLQILEEEHQSSSDSMMSQSADSQIPSVNQSKQFKTSMDIRGKNKMSMSKSSMRPKSNHFSEDKHDNIDFLKKCLSSINQLQREVERIEKQLEQKNRMLSLFLGENTNKEELIHKLSVLESKIKLNDREMRNHFQTSQLQVAALIKDLLKYRQAKDQYGLQNESRKKIEEYLGLLEQQLLKNSKFYEQDFVRIQQPGRKNDSPIRVGGSLHQIKEDAINEDKGSSIVNPKGTQILRSFSNSQGATESLDINQIRQNYNQVLRELHEAHDELADREQIIRNMHLKYKIIQQQVFSVLDETRMNLEEDQYLIEQIQKIKDYMTKYLQEEPTSHKIKDSQEKIEDQKPNILVQSNQKDINNLQSSRKQQNPFQKILKLNNHDIERYVEAITNENLKEIYHRIQEILNQRFDDCMDFLNSQKSLIADILKIRDDQAYLQSTMNKIASKLTTKQIQDIIRNSHNRLEANKILNYILRDDDIKSMISDEHDFSPNGNKIQQIRNKVYPRPTQLSLSIHNQLLQILAAPTRQEFYQLIQEFYKILKDFQDRFQLEISEKDERSENHSIRIQKVLEGPRQNLECSRESFNYLDIKHQKNRSSSCTISVAQNSQGN